MILLSMIKFHLPSIVSLVNAHFPFIVTKNTGLNCRENRGISHKPKNPFYLRYWEFIDTICDKNKNLKNKMSRWKENIMTRIVNKIVI